MMADEAAIEDYPFIRETFVSAIGADDGIEVSAARSSFTGGLLGTGIHGRQLDAAGRLDTTI